MCNLDLSPEFLCFCQQCFLLQPLLLLLRKGVSIYDAPDELVLLVIADATALIG